MEHENVTVPVYKSRRGGYGWFVSSSASFLFPLAKTVRIAVCLLFHPIRK